MLIKHTNQRIAQLLSHKRYAEAYILLKNGPPHEPSTMFNIALCHYWAHNYHEALTCLEKAEIALPHDTRNTLPDTDNFYKIIRDKQSQIDDRRKVITQKYVSFSQVRCVTP
jgi:hypothetical protein